MVGEKKFVVEINIKKEKNVENKREKKYYP